MEIKGVVVKSVSDFVRSKFSDRYDEWVKCLPDESKQIFEKTIFLSKWYPMREGVVIPTQFIGKLFYGNNDRQAAWQSGRYAAQANLKGIYRILAKIISYSFVFSKSGRIFSTYFRIGSLSVVRNGQRNVVVQLKDFHNPDQLVEFRIAGWIEHALEISGCNGVIVVITKSMAKGHRVTEYIIQWA